jgi:hypothetical protein
MAVKRISAESRRTAKEVNPNNIDFGADDKGKKSAPNSMLEHTPCGVA